MESEISFLKSWAIYFVLAILMAVFVGAVSGFAVGMVLGLIGVDRSLVQLITGTLGLIVGLYSSFFVYRWSIKKYIIPQITTG